MSKLENEAGLLEVKMLASPLKRMSKKFSINIQLPRLAIMCGNNLAERYEIMRNFTVT